MKSSDQNSDVPALETLVTEERIREIAKSFGKGNPGEEKDPLAACPALRDFLYDESLKIAGRMGLCGASGHVIRGVFANFKQLNGIVVEVLREALWEPFLPATGTRNDSAEPEAAEAEKNVESASEGSGPDEEGPWDAGLPS